MALNESNGGRNGIRRTGRPPPPASPGVPVRAELQALLDGLRAAVRGDFDARLPHREWRGIGRDLAEALNELLDLHASFARELVRVERVVGREGHLRARVSLGKEVHGGWAASIAAVNALIGDLAKPTLDVARVIGSVASGDLSVKMALHSDGQPLQGEFARMGETVNAMVERLGTFADQVTTVAREVGVEGKLGGQAKVPGAAGTWRQLTDNVNQLAANLTAQVRAISEVATAVTKGEFTRSIDVPARGEVALLKDTINQMIVNLKETTQKNTEQDWLKTNLARFSSMMQGQKSLEAVSDMIMSELTPLVSAHHGAFFMMGIDGGASILELTSTYAYRERKHVSNRFRIGEGLVGQCARERKPILLSHVPSDYILINSGLGEAAPLNIIVLPALFEGEVKAVIELASFQPFSAIHQRFLDQLMSTLGVVLNVINANMRTEKLLLQSQGLTQELQSQSKELKLQQRELRRTNLALEKQALELEEKARQLATQNAKVEIKNGEVEQARRSLEDKAEQLSMASRYKSEFLANMSHELRTPLNSLLILARLLADNAEGNLTAAQVEYARTIYTCGTDLLSLINEILDLSKVEAGKMRVEPRTLAVADLIETLRAAFQPVADQKGLTLSTSILPGAAETIVSDPQRVQQILRNLLSNAFKFTDRGRVDLRVRRETDVAALECDSLRGAGRVIAFDVMDTGIGIPRDKQKLIFEAFQQADGTTSRKYGGTGLGLSISREIARILGGEIHVTSAPGGGSTFTLLLPESLDAGARPQSTPSPVAETAAPAALLDASAPPGRMALPSAVQDDRDAIRPGDRVLLVIEDDESFAKILVSIGHQQGFRVVVAPRGDLGLQLATELRPSAITLDLQLPVADGWTVLDRLKRDPATRHIPVQVISILERNERGAALGAFAYLEKPVTKDALDGAFAHLRSFVDRTIRMLLLVEDDDLQRGAIARSLAELGDVEVVSVNSAEAALAELQGRPFDCMIVDLVLPGLDGIGLIAEVKQHEARKDLPIIVYTGKDLDEAEDRKLRQFASSVVVKSGLASLEDLGAQTKRFLHRTAAPVRAGGDGGLAGKTVLIVDDDARTIFALSSAMEAAGVRVVYAESGSAAIETLARTPEVDAVFMDIMMPEMDGYETIRTIRRDPEHAALPIIALTAKALTGDRERCLDAGASDYLAKPVFTDALLERLRRWTTEQGARASAPAPADTDEGAA